jgi:OmpA-OmpF porin, OOP family
MKLRFLMIALATATPLFAHAADSTGVYLDGALGRGPLAKIGGVDDSTAAALAVGYRWSWFGLDLGYVDFSRENGSINNIWSSSSDPEQLYRYGAREHGFTFDATGRWSLGEHWYYSARAGLYSSHGEFYQQYYEPAPIKSKFSQNDLSWNAGIGFGYDFSKSFSLGLRYDWYRDDLGTSRPLSLNAEVRF